MSSTAKCILKEFFSPKDAYKLVGDGENILI